MKRIFKYSLGYSENQEIKMPEDAKVVSFQSMNSGLFIWALVDDDNLLKPRHFFITTTGQAITENNLHYIGTEVVNNSMVYHLFEVV